MKSLVFCKFRMPEMESTNVISLGRIGTNGISDCSTFVVGVESVALGSVPEHDGP